MRRRAARTLLIVILSLTGLSLAMPALHAALDEGRVVADTIWPNAPPG